MEFGLHFNPKPTSTQYARMERLHLATQVAIVCARIALPSNLRPRWQPEDQICNDIVPCLVDFTVTANLTPIQPVGF